MRVILTMAWSRLGQLQPDRKLSIYSTIKACVKIRDTARKPEEILFLSPEDPVYPCRYGFRTRFENVGWDIVLVGCTAVSKRAVTAEHCSFLMSVW